MEGSPEAKEGCEETVGTQQPLQELRHVPKGQFVQLGEDGAAAGDVDRRLSPRTYVGAEWSEQCFRQVL